MTRATTFMTRERHASDDAGVVGGGGGGGVNLSRYILCADHRDWSGYRDLVVPPRPCRSAASLSLRRGMAFVTTDVQ